MLPMAIRSQTHSVARENRKMAKIQLTNLQCKHQLDTSQLKQVVGGFDEIQRWINAFLNVNTPDGAINTAILNAHGRAFLAGDVNKTNQLGDLWTKRVELAMAGQDSVFQIVAPL